MLREMYLHKCTEELHSLHIHINTFSVVQTEVKKPLGSFSYLGLKAVEAAGVGTRCVECYPSKTGAFFKNPGFTALLYLCLYAYVSTFKHRNLCS